MTDFYKKLMEKSGFDEALVRHALDFTKELDINEFSRLFFVSQDFSVENTGVLSFDEAFIPLSFTKSSKLCRFRPKLRPFIFTPRCCLIHIPIFSKGLTVKASFLTRQNGFMSLQTSIFYTKESRAFTTIIFLQIMSEEAYYGLACLNISTALMTVKRQ